MLKAHTIRARRHLLRGKWFHRLNFLEHHPLNLKSLLAQLLILSTNRGKVPTKIMLVTTRKKLIQQRRLICLKDKLTMLPAPLMRTTTTRMEEDKMRLSQRCIVTIPSLNSQIKRSRSRSIVVRKSTSE